MEDTQRKTNTHIVLDFDRCDTLFLVLEEINPREVWFTKNSPIRLDERWSHCGKFPKLHMSFSHVVATCKHVHHECKNYIHLVYMLESVSKVYKGLLWELCNEAYRSPCHEPIIYLDPENRVNQSDVPCVASQTIQKKIAPTMYAQANNIKSVIFFVF